ncbi:MAG: TetR/AcrR family transcriptional regulator [Blastocatellia bacterium]
MKTEKKQTRLNGTERLNDIYRVAARIICEKGYDGTSMSDIADAVGITKAGVYHHIAGKRELLFAIMSYGMDSLENAVITPARSIADPEQRLRAVIINHARLITTHSTPQGNFITIVVDEVAGLTPDHRQEITRRKRAYIDLVRETLKELSREGKLREVDPTVGAFSLLGMILWLSRWYDPNGRLSSEQVADEVSKIALSGLLTPGPTSGPKPQSAAEPVYDPAPLPSHSPDA